MEQFKSELKKAYLDSKEVYNDSITSLKKKFNDSGKNAFLKFLILIYCLCKGVWIFIVSFITLMFTGQQRLIPIILIFIVIYIFVLIFNTPAAIIVIGLRNVCISALELFVSFITLFREVFSWYPAFNNQIWEGLTMVINEILPFLGDITVSRFNYLIDILSFTVVATTSFTNTGIAIITKLQNALEHDICLISNDNIFVICTEDDDMDIKMALSTYEPVYSYIDETTGNIIKSYTWTIMSVIEAIIEVIFDFIGITWMAINAFGLWLMQIVGALLLPIVQLFFNMIVLPLYYNVMYSVRGTGPFPTNMTELEYKNYINAEFAIIDPDIIFDENPVELLNRTDFDGEYGLIGYRMILIEILLFLDNLKSVVFSNIISILTFVDLKWCCILHLDQCLKSMYVCEIVFYQNGIFENVLNAINPSSINPYIPFWVFGVQQCCILDSFNPIAMGVYSLRVIMSIVIFFVSGKKIVWFPGEGGHPYGELNYQQSEINYEFTQSMYLTCRSFYSSDTCPCYAYQLDPLDKDDQILLNSSMIGTGIDESKGLTGPLFASTSFETGIPCNIMKGSCLTGDTIYEQTNCISTTSNYKSLLTYLFYFANTKVINSQSLSDDESQEDIGNIPYSCTLWGGMTQSITYTGHKYLGDIYDPYEGRYNYIWTFPSLVIDPLSYASKSYIHDPEVYLIGDEPCFSHPEYRECTEAGVNSVAFQGTEFDTVLYYYSKGTFTTNWDLYNFDVQILRNFNDWCSNETLQNYEDFIKSPSQDLYVGNFDTPTRTSLGLNPTTYRLIGINKARTPFLPFILPLHMRDNLLRNSAFRYYNYITNLGSLGYNDLLRVDDLYSLEYYDNNYGGRFNMWYWFLGPMFDRYVANTDMSSNNFVRNYDIYESKGQYYTGNLYRNIDLLSLSDILLTSICFGETKNLTDIEKDINVTAINQGIQFNKLQRIILGNDYREYYSTPFYSSFETLYIGNYYPLYTFQYNFFKDNVITNMKIPEYGDGAGFCPLGKILFNKNDELDQYEATEIMASNLINEVRNAILRIILKNGIFGDDWDWTDKAFPCFGDITKCSSYGRYPDWRYHDPVLLISYVLGNSTGISSFCNLYKFTGYYTPFNLTRCIEQLSLITAAKIDTYIKTQNNTAEYYYNGFYPLFYYPTSLDSIKLTFYYANSEIRFKNSQLYRRFKNRLHMDKIRTYVADEDYYQLDRMLIKNISESIYRSVANDTSFLYTKNADYFMAYYKEHTDKIIYPFTINMNATSDLFAHLTDLSPYFYVARFMMTEPNYFGVILTYILNTYFTVDGLCSATIQCCDSTLLDCVLTDSEVGVSALTIIKGIFVDGPKVWYNRLMYDMNQTANAYTIKHFPNYYRMMLRNFKSEYVPSGYIRGTYQHLSEVMAFYYNVTNETIIYNIGSLLKKLKIALGYYNLLTIWDNNIADTSTKLSTMTYNCIHANLHENLCNSFVYDKNFYQYYVNPLLVNTTQVLLTYFNMYCNYTQYCNSYKRAIYNFEFDM